MDRYALIGYPIQGSLSPLLFQAAYRGKWDYDLIEYADFDKCLRTFIDGPYKAINVTAPFKADAIKAAERADRSAIECSAANILVKRKDSLEAYNSDFLALGHLLEKAKDVTVIGGGGAGRAALQAAVSLGLSTRMLHHDELTRNIEADTIVFTLPREVEGLQNLRCRTLIEANYKTPCCKNLAGIENYIPGTHWLAWQAILGYEIMTGETPDKDNILRAIRG